jgi:hypothetical protein
MRNEYIIDLRPHLKEILISQSFLNAAYNCYGQYYFFLQSHTINPDTGMPFLVQIGKLRTWPATIMGTAIHSILEQVVLKKMENPKEYNRNLILWGMENLSLEYAKAEEEAKNENFEIGETKSYSVDALKKVATTSLITLLHNILTTYFTEGNFPFAVYPELEVHTYWEHCKESPIPIHIQGTLDLVLLQTPTSGGIIDYKTSREPQKFMKQERSKEDDPQSGLYSYLFEKHFGFFPEYFVYKVLDLWENKLIEEFYPTAYNVMLLNRRIEGVVRKIFCEPDEITSNFIPEKKTCKFCNYRKICPVSKYPME